METNKRKRFVVGLSCLALGWILVAEAAAGDPRLELALGQETTVMTGDVMHAYLFRSRKGTLVVQTFTARPAGRVVPKQNVFPLMPRYMRSEDGGQTWQAWSARPDQGEGPTTEGAVVELRDGTILIFDWIADERGQGLFVGTCWTTRDEWRTVIGPEESHFSIPEAVGQGFDDGGRPVSGIFVHRSVLEEPNGDLLATLYGWFKGDTTPVEYQPTMNKFRCLLVRSKDRGRNWSYLSTIAVDPSVGQEGFDEAVLVRLTQGKRKGRLVCLMRTGRITSLYQTFSDDNGKTWSKPRPANLPVGVDPDLIEMSNGVLVTSFGHHEVSKKDSSEDGNFLAFSFDQGETWTNLTRLSSGRTSQYTTVRETQPGELLVVYDDCGKTPRIIARKVKVRLQ